MKAIENLVHVQGLVKYIKIRALRCICRTFLPLYLFDKVIYPLIPITRHLNRRRIRLHS
jgi:hypothetical protein